VKIDRALGRFGSKIRGFIAQSDRHISTLL
jgi:hypothetical protein